MVTRGTQPEHQANCLSHLIPRMWNNFALLQHYQPSSWRYVSCRARKDKILTSSLGKGWCRPSRLGCLTRWGNPAPYWIGERADSKVVLLKDRNILPVTGDKSRNSADTYAERGFIPSPDAKAKGGRGQQASRGHRLRWSSQLNESRSALISLTHFGFPDWSFFHDFSSVVKANARVYDANAGHGPHSPPTGAAASPKRLTNVAYFQLAAEPVWAQNPDNQPTEVYPSHT